LVGEIEKRKDMVLRLDDRQRIVEMVALLKGGWRDASIDKLRLSAGMAGDFVSKQKGLPPDPVMNMAAKALLADIAGNSGEDQVRRDQLIIVFGLVGAIIRGLEGEKP
jgi:hypothetical protein